MKSSQEIYDTAIELLQKIRRRPGAWFTDKETLTSSVDMILILLLRIEEQELTDFKYLTRIGNTCVDSQDRFDDEWAHEVVDYALDLVNQKMANSKRIKFKFITLDGLRAALVLLMEEKILLVSEQRLFVVVKNVSEDMLVALKNLGGRVVEDYQGEID